MSDPFTRIGIVGCGDIARKAYMVHLKPYDNVAVTACADLNAEATEQFAADFDLQAMSVDELIRSDQVDLVLNLTIPAAHTPVNLQAIAAGKHAYCEKPLALTVDDGRKQVEAAKAAGVRLGCAPDTVLGGGVQTCRKLIDDGAIGTPVSCTAFMACPGHESWHPSPVFYYKPGGGPMLDMGPYYLTALVTLLGPIDSVAGLTGRARDRRTITSQPLNGTVVDVEVDTHQAGAVRFANGAIGTLVMSFDTWAHHLPCIEVHGTEGSLVVPDPNGFGGKVQLHTTDRKAGWQEVEHTHNTETGRGVGVAEMALAARRGTPHRCSGELALHVLEAMTAFERSSAAGEHVKLETTCDRPEPIAPGLASGALG